MKLPKILPFLVYSALASNFSRCVISSYEMFFNLSGPIILAGRTVLAVATYLFILIAFVLWIFRTAYATNRTATEQRTYSDSEYQCAVLNIALLVYAFLTIIITNFIFPASNWSNSSERNLASYAYLQLAFTVIVTSKY